MHPPVTDKKAAAPILEDRHRRFGRALSDDSVRKYVSDIDFARDVVLVVTDDDLSFIGAAPLGLAAAGGRFMRNPQEN
ncbi:MAG: hypothetical protein WBA29_01550 [Xanthobacteraceae bacterium]